MIVILHQRGLGVVAKRIASDLRMAFANRVQVRPIEVRSSSRWPAAPSWDDLLIVLFDKGAFPATGNAFINDYLRVRKGRASVLPVAIDPSTRVPPTAAEAIKALEYDRSAKGPKGKLVNRVGGMLGLMAQGRDSKIFISYRKNDGFEIAKQLHKHFTSLGHNVFLDEAVEIDGQTKILPGSPVQKQIDEALQGANLVLLLDTKAASESKWIAHEVDTADSLLLPILPICFRDKGDPKQGPNFKSLLALQRWVQFQTPNPASNPLLSSDQVEEIAAQAEKYLCEIFQRKCRVPFLVEKEFVTRGFAWSVLDQHLLMFRSEKGTSWRVRTKVLSHCSIFTPSYGAAMQRFLTFLKGADRHNFSLFLYDGELIPEPQLQRIAEEARDDSMIILHHQELAALVDSNFTNLPLTA